MSKHVVYRDQWLFNSPVKPINRMPGFKTSGPSEQAAIKIAPKAKILRGQVLEALRLKAMTAHECAEYLGESTYAVSPRISELRDLGDVVDSGQRRPNKTSGHMATVWRVTKQESTHV